MLAFRVTLVATLLIFSIILEHSNGLEVDVNVAIKLPKGERTGIVGPSRWGSGTGPSTGPRESKTGTGIVGPSRWRSRTGPSTGPRASPDNVPFGPYGAGSGGSHFTDKSVFQAHGPITGIQYKLGKFGKDYTYVYSIRASYGGVWAPWHPESQMGVKQTCGDPIDPISYPIVQVKGNAGSYINHLEFVSTNNQTCGSSTQGVGSYFQTQTNPPNAPYESCNPINYLEGSTGHFNGQLKSPILVSLSFNFACQTPPMRNKQLAE